MSQEEKKSKQAKRELETVLQKRDESCNKEERKVWSNKKVGVRNQRPFYEWEYVLPTSASVLIKSPPSKFCVHFSIRMHEFFLWIGKFPKTTR